MTDTEMIDWIEKRTTLHYNVEFLYVVDGYEVSIMYDDFIVCGPFFGDDIRSAIITAIRDGA